MPLNKIVWPGLIAAAVILAGPLFFTMLTARANPSPTIAQAEDDAATASDEGEDAAGDAMLEKADVAAAIGAIEAHVRAGKELLAAGKAAEAEALFGRARDLLSPEMNDSLSEAGVPPLAEALAATAKGDAAAVDPAAVDAAVTALAAAREGAGAGVPDSARYGIEAAVSLLYYGAEEYGDWIDAPGPETIVDYQGARGVALLAAAMIEPLKPAVARLNQESANGLAASLAAILRAFPDMSPPAKPVVLEGDINAAIAAINEYGEGF